MGTIYHAMGLFPDRSHTRKSTVVPIRRLHSVAEQDITEVGSRGMSREIRLKRVKLYKRLSWLNVDLRVCLYLGMAGINTIPGL